MELSRRRFLGGMGAVAAGVVLEACAGGKAKHVAGLPPPAFARAAGQRPDPSRPEGTDRIPQIEHVIVLMMENHSYDNYLGMLGRGDGFQRDANGRPANANRDTQGRVLRAFHMPNTCQLKRQPSNNWTATHTQWNGGAMDGFVRSDSGPVAMGYWTGDDLPFYYGLASTFPLCDRWFASCMGQTFAQRKFLVAATSNGTIHTLVSEVTGPPPPGGTILDLLNRHGIAWRNYYSSIPTTGAYLPVLQANGDKVVKIDRFFSDAKAGRLPAFAIVDPDFDNQSEENSNDITLGESFASRVINAVMKSPAWPRTLLVWCYDEHGGYYDHVPPPPAVPPDSVAPKLLPGDVPGAFDRYGFRVPAVVVSPWARRHHVSHVVHDHTSVLALLEAKFNLPALTARDGHADDLRDCLDLTGTPPFRTPPVLPPPHNPSDTEPLCTKPGPIPQPA